MKIEIKQHELTFLQQRQAAITSAENAARTAALLAQQAEAVVETQREALLQAVICVAGGQPIDLSKIAAIDFGRTGDTCTLNIVDKPEPAKE